MEQLKLDEARSRADQIFQRFVIFHRANPHVWDLFCRFADEIRRGRKYYSARIILERVRWEMDVAPTTEADPTKLNNDFAPYYARMYLATRPGAEDFFKLRKRTSEERMAYDNDLSFHYSGAAGDEEALLRQLRELAGEDANDL